MGRAGRAGSRSAGPGRDVVGQVDMQWACSQGGLWTSAMAVVATLNSIFRLTSRNAVGASRAVDAGGCALVGVEGPDGALLALGGACWVAGGCKWLIKPVGRRGRQEAGGRSGP